MHINILNYGYLRSAPKSYQIIIVWIRLSGAETLLNDKSFSPGSQAGDSWAMQVFLVLGDLLEWNIIVGNWGGQSVTRQRRRLKTSKLWQNSPDGDYNDWCHVKVRLPLTATARPTNSLDEPPITHQTSQSTWCQDKNHFSTFINRFSLSPSNLL